MTAAPPRPVSNWNLPNALTVARILAVPVFGWLLVQQHGQVAALRWWATVVFVAAILTDRIDGDLARRYGQITNFGKVADPIADKALTGMALVGLSVVDEMPWWITILILVREWGITVLRFVVIRHGVMPAGRGGKLKTTLQAVALGFFCAPLSTLPVESAWRALAWIVLWVAIVVTVVTGIDYVIKAITLRQTSARAELKRTRRAQEAARRAREAAQRARDATRRGGTT